MADLYGTSPQSSTPSSNNQDDISSYFQTSSCMTQFIPCFSSPSSSRPENMSMPALENGHGFGGSRGAANQVESSSGINMDFSDPASFFKENGFFSVLDSNSDASFKRKCISSENDVDEFICDSEGPEASEMPLNPPRPRSSSKRSRAAEVHNLSEKRRRSKINEKMKALQSLIPNSNKTDKASMLDEAIEYLKQLQLQVQMLTLRNGLGLPPMCLPRAIQPVQLPHMGRVLEDRITHANQENSLQTAYSLPNLCTPSSQPPVITSLPDMRNVETSYGFELPVQAQFEQLNSPNLSKEIYRGNLLPQVEVDSDQCCDNSSSGVS